MGKQLDAPMTAADVSGSGADRRASMQRFRSCQRQRELFGVFNLWTHNYILGPFGNRAPLRRLNKTANNKHTLSGLFEYGRAVITVYLIRYDDIYFIVFHRNDSPALFSARRGHSWRSSLSFLVH